MFDFKGNSSTLTKLENDLISSSEHKLIDDWTEGSNDLKYLRKDINYLRVYNILTVRSHKVKHVTDLINGSVSRFHPKGAHGGKIKLHINNGILDSAYPIFK